MENFKTIKSKLSKIIEKNRCDNFKNHFLYSINIIDYNYQGRIEEDRLIIWRKTLFSDILYSVITIQPDIENKIALDIKINIFGKTTYWAFTICIIFLIISLIFYDNYYLIRDFDIRLGLGIIMIFGWFILSYYANKILKVRDYNYLIDTLNEIQ